MKAKKLMSMVLVGVATMSLLTGCSSNTNNSQEENTEQTETEAETQSETEAETQNETETEIQSETGETSNEASNSGNTLVVYYSATGNTETVANYIADATGGDLFELEPVEPYTDEDLNYNDENSRVSQEYADESLRYVELVSTTVDGFEDYSVVYIGYPVWWGIAAWPVNQFVENNDFTGKTVIPFCTSASSGIGDSGTLLEEMAGTGNWLEGRRFRSSASEEDVVAWVDSLGL